MRMWLIAYWWCFIACACLPLIADIFKHMVGQAILIAVAAVIDLQGGLCSWAPQGCLCKSHFLVPAMLWYRVVPHLQTILLGAAGSHLSMLIAQRFKMLAVHIITSMVTKISQQMRLKVQTPPVTCTSNHKSISLVLHQVLISYV